MRKILLITLFFISGCGVSFYPYELPEAEINKEYIAYIKISGGIVIGESLDIKFSPSNSGINIIPIGSGFKEYNFLMIKGIPKESGNINLKIFLMTYGTNLNGRIGEKEYIIKVK